MSASILSVRDVHKRFTNVHAVDGVSFEVQRGEILGVLGPNGAGKTTLIRMILGIFAPDRGEILFHLVPGARSLRERIGYLPEERGLYEDRKVSDTLLYFAQLKNVPRARAHERALWWLARLQLDGCWERRVRELSKGMQQKVQWTAAVLHEPEFVVLDEPFSGLDPLNQDRVKDLIQDLRSRGVTVMLSAHQMNLVEDLCDRIVLINRGRRVLYGELREIQRRHGEHRVHIGFRGDGEKLRQCPVARVIELTAQRAELVLGPTVTPDSFLRYLAQMLDGADFAVEQLKITRPPLHDIFVQIIASGEGRPAADADRSPLGV